MGNGMAMGSSKRAKVMKITGETMKLKTPVLSSDVLKDYPGYVLLESDLVKKYGIRAKPLELYQELKPKKVYFLVELPKLPEEKVPGRVRSAVHMSAKDRLECLMLTRRSSSDVSNKIRSGSTSNSGPMQVKMRLPRAQVEKLVKDSKNESEIAEKIINLCLQNSQEEDKS